VLPVFDGLHLRDLVASYSFAILRLFRRLRATLLQYSSITRCLQNPGPPKMATDPRQTRVAVQACDTRAAVETPEIHTVVEAHQTQAVQMDAREIHAVVEAREIHAVVEAREIHAVVEAHPTQAVQMEAREIHAVDKVFAKSPFYLFASAHHHRVVTSTQVVCLLENRLPMGTARCWAAIQPMAANNWP
jgi:hypothetical protein